MEVCPSHQLGAGNNECFASKGGFELGGMNTEVEFLVVDAYLRGPLFGWLQRNFALRKLDLFQAVTTPLDGITKVSVPVR